MHTLLRALCFCSVTQISTISVFRLHQLFFWISLSLCFSPFWWFRAEERHLSVMSRDRRRKRHPRHHQVAERRGCAGTWPLQRSVIHDTTKLLNGDAGLWVGVVTGTRKTHIITFFGGRVLMFCHNHEAITTPSPLPGQAALRGESGCSPRKALPGPSSARLPLHRRAAGRVLLRIYQRRSGRHTNLARHRTVALFLRYFRVNTPGRAPGCCAGLLRWAAALGCCGVVLRRRAGGPRGVHKLSRHATNSLLHISFGFILS